MRAQRFRGRRSAALLTVCVGSVLGSGASAQCDPTWDNTLGDPGINRGYVQPMVAWDDGTGEKLYAGGSAEGFGGFAAIEYLGVYDPATGQWSRPGLGIGQGSTNAFLTKLLPWDDGTGEKLYVTGQFASAGGMTSASSFAVWDGSSWSDVGAGFTQADQRVTYDLLPFTLDARGEVLLVAGNFEEIGGVAAGSVAIYDGTGFSEWGTGLGLADAGSSGVFALEPFDDGTGMAIYAGGRFPSIDNAFVNNFARFNVGDGAWEALPEQLQFFSPFDSITSMAVFDDGTGPALYVAGDGFRVPGDSNIYLCAKWDGTSWTGIGQELSGRITDIEVFDDGNGPALYMSGTATFEVNYFAKLEGGVWQPALGGGVNNPPVNGNFASAFGLYTWDDQLLVGGNFTQVGGFDPTTGAGSGTPIASAGIAAIVACGDAACSPADLSSPNNPGEPDGVLTGADFFEFLSRFQAGDLSVDFSSASNPGVPDGVLTGADFFEFLNLFTIGC